MISKFLITAVLALSLGACVTTSDYDNDFDVRDRVNEIAGQGQ